MKRAIFKKGAPPEKEHLWALYDCANRAALLDSNLDLHMVKALNDSKIETYRNIAHKFPPPGGVTALVIVGASRADAHTWPEFGTCILGCFACGDKDRQVYEFLERMVIDLRPRLVFEIPERIVYPYKPAKIPASYKPIKFPLPVV